MSVVHICINVLPFQPSTANNLGTLNNIVTVKKSDFEVFEALALDSVNTTTKSKQSKYDAVLHCCMLWRNFLPLHSSFQPTATNSLGSLNNVVTVKKSDFEVFEALAIDSINTTHKNKHSKCRSWHCKKKNSHFYCNFVYLLMYTAFLPGQLSYNDGMLVKMFCS